MIVDQFERLETYACLSDNFAHAIRFLKSLEPGALKEQSFDIDGDKLYAFSKHFPLLSKEEASFESHERYADIQLVLDGRESIYVCDTGTLKPKTPYDPQKDIVFYHDEVQCTQVELLPRQFGIFFPWDAHKPCCISGDCKLSHKLVVKVRL